MKQQIDNDDKKGQISTQKHLLEVQIDKYDSLTKTKEFKICMLEFLKPQKNLRKQDMEKFQNQCQGDLERHRKELEQQEETLSKFQETFSKREIDPGSSDIFSQDSIINSIGEFIYKPDKEVTFGAYFQRYKEIFQKDCVTWSDGKIVQLLVCKFGAVEHEKYGNFILLRHLGEIPFQETIQILTKIFREWYSLFNRRWQCLNLTKKENIVM